MMNCLKKWVGGMALSATLVAVAAPAEINVPLRKVSGAPGSVLKADAPFQEGFYSLGTDKAAPLQTRWKFVHDNTNLYLAVEVLEPEPAGIAHLNKNYKNDSRQTFNVDCIELNVMPVAAPDCIYKTIITADGFIDDLSNTDDNTGTETYVENYSWESHAKVISKSIGTDRWSLEVAFPLGAYCNGEKVTTPDLAIILGRTRLRNGRLAFSANTITPREFFISPRAFRKLVLQEFNPDPWKVEVGMPVVKCSRVAGKLQAQISCSVVNRTGKRSIIRVSNTLSNRNGVKINLLKTGNAYPGVICNIAGTVDVPADGSYMARLELLDSRSRLLSQRVFPLELSYQPIKIVVKEPFYRQNIYATQNIPEIKADILLEEGIGKPLEVTLKGKNLNLVRKIASAKKVNSVTFPASDLPIGDYTLTAGSASTMIRKLPKGDGEVWFDKDGITYVDGKPFMAYGFYGIAPKHDIKGCQVLHSYNFKYHNPQELLKDLDNAHAAGLKVIMPPYQEYTFSWTMKTFAFSERQRTTLTAEQRRLLVNFANLVKSHPAFLGYYAADEPEGWGISPEWQKEVFHCLREADPYHPVIMLNYGMDGIRMYYEGCDILMPDCYPSYFLDGTTSRERRCSYDFAKLALELSHSCWLVPQAFDFARISPKDVPGCAPSFDELRQQNFLAFIGNAKGIIPYSYCYRCQGYISTRVGICEMGPEIIALQSLLLRPTDTGRVTTDRGEKELMVGVKRLGDQLAVIAVSMSKEPFTASIKVPGAVPTKLAVSGEKRSVQVKNGAITDTFAPHETHVYLSAGIPADSVDLAAIRAEIVRQEKLRRKPGNLLASGGLTYVEQLQYAEGKLSRNIPRITASSQIVQKPYSCYGPYWIQDGIIEAEPRECMMFYAPMATDKAPWIEVDFGKEVKVGRVELYSLLHQGRSALNDFRIWNADNGALLATVKDNHDFQATAKFDTVTLRKLKITLDKIDNTLPRRLLTEMEVYEK